MGTPFDKLGKTQAAGLTGSPGKSSARVVTVSNTDLASWTGSVNIATVGTITVGTWQGTVIGDSYISSSAAWNAKESPLTFSTGLTRSVNTITVNSSQSISTLSNLTTNGLIRTSGGTGALSVDTSTYLTGNQTITLSGDLSGSGATSIAATIAANAVSLSKFQQVSSKSILGRSTAGTGNIEVLNATSTKVLLALDNVENVKLSTWAGTTAVTTLGTITTGTWSGTTVGISKGGTGQTTAANAINALLPSQTGQSGKVLGTNGTTAAWVVDGGGGGSGNSYFPSGW